MNWENDPYSILGVSPDATIRDIKAVYRKIAQRLHPDINKHPEAAQQFEAASAAYELLTDTMRRKKHDAQIEQESQTKDDEVENSFFTLKVTSSKQTVLPLAENQVIYLLIDIFPDASYAEEHENRETRLNLALVLDRSNSMRGPRMDKVKVAAHQIIDNMAEDDIISIITFNARADTLIPATTLRDRPALKANVSMISPTGGTEIYRGLAAGMEQINANIDSRMVNHIILLTDGHTFGDQHLCLELAREAGTAGVGISAMGLGHDWNDEFLDEIASTTGGNSVYINSASAVVKFLNDQVRSLINAFAERMALSIVPDPDVVLESAFKLSPHPQPLSVDSGRLLLGSLQMNHPLSILLQFQLPGDMTELTRHVARVVVQGDILMNRPQDFFAVGDLTIEVTRSATSEYAPDEILDALSKLALYRLQERAHEALEDGDVEEATRRLENLATRLLEIGQNSLANQALSEARKVAHTSGLSNRGRKTLKYATRHLLTSHINEDDLK